MPSGPRTGEIVQKPACSGGERKEEDEEAESAADASNRKRRIIAANGNREEAMENMIKLSWSWTAFFGYWVLERYLVGPVGLVGLVDSCSVVI
jgi:hypothetical protein